MKMGKIKGSKKQSKEVRKENHPYYGNSHRRSTTGQTSSSQLQQSSTNTMSDSSEEEVVSSAGSAPSSAFSHSSGSWGIGALCEEYGVTPLPPVEESDSHAVFSTAPVAVVTVVGPETTHSSSSLSYTTLSSSSSQRHVTPAVQTHRRESLVGEAPMAPRVLGVSQKENCPRNVSASAVSLFYGMLTPPRKDDMRPRHHFPTGPDYFEHISEEVILHIFSFLTRPSLARCMRVCRKWHRVGGDESLWRRVDLAQKAVKARTLGQLVRRGTTHLRLARAEVKGNRVRDIYSRPEDRPRMSRLQYLDLSMTSVSKEMLADIFAHCRQLRKVSLENVPVNETVFHLLSENANLDTLNLSMCQGVTSSGLMPLFAHCRILTHLNLAWTGMDRSCVVYACGAMPDSVRLLNFSGCREAIADEDVENLCRRCPQLLELDLSDSLHLTENSIAAVRHNLTDLRRLSLSRCYSVPPSVLVSLGGLPRLSALNVIGMLGRDPVEELQELMPKVTVNKMPFSTVARPTFGPRRTSIWEQRVREAN